MAVTAKAMVMLLLANCVCGWGCVFSWYCDVGIYVLSSFATISLKKIELVALLLFYSYFYVGGFACLCLVSFSHGVVA